LRHDVHLAELRMRSLSALNGSTAKKGTAEQSRGSAKRQVTMPALGAILFAAQAVQGATQSGLNDLSVLTQHTQ
jgi:hypothetical protein